MQRTKIKIPWCIRCQQLEANTFLIVNDSHTNSSGRHKFLLCNRDKQVVVADPLGLSIYNHRDVCRRFCSHGNNAQICQSRVKTQYPIVILYPQYPMEISSEARSLWKSQYLVESSSQPRILSAVFSQLPNFFKDR